jgi:hypothetical protein
VSVLELIYQRFKHLEKPKEIILQAVSERCRAEASEFFSGKRGELSKNCENEVVKAVYMYAAEVYLMLKPLNAVAKSYRVLYELFAGKG